ncbi:MAG TPA: APC family permease [Candidatus Aquilonibacter sp.]|nr:APC family permease [Candidatus Aquilonibacter sp.]
MAATEQLERGLGLAEATALNITFMVGIGPFVVIPLVVQAMGGPQSLIAWVLGAILALFDGCVWAELGAAMPQAGGSYVFLREAYGPKRWGHLMSFLYIWQTLFQGPLSIASGALGFADYSTYLTGKSDEAGRILGMFGRHAESVMAATIVLIAVVLLYRRIRAIGRISIVLCVIVIGTILWLIYGGATHFHPGLVLTFPKGAWNLSWIFFAGLGHATVQTVYSYLGYYNVCNLGGEMKNPERNIPRAIFLSIIGISILYFAMQTSILGVIPWQEAAKTKAVVSLFVERVFGSGWANLATVLILITAFGSVFSATLGYSRVPYAAAQDGNFFAIFGRVHKKGHFPYVSLLALGAAAIVFSLSLTLRDAIRSILAMRCIIQFVAQAAGLILLRRKWGTGRLPFRMWLYPLPVAIAIVGWTAIFISTGSGPMLAATAAASVGILVYLVRANWRHEWPFEGVR